MQVFASVRVAGAVVKARLHPRFPWMACMARTAQQDEVVVWRIDADGAISETLRLTHSSPSPGGVEDDSPDPWRGRLRDIAWHPHQESLAIVKSETRIELWDVSRCTTLRRLSDIPADNAVAFSPSGHWAVFSAQTSDEGCRSLCMCDLNANGECVTRWESDTTYAFHPSESVLAGGWNDQGGGMIRFLKLPYTNDSRDCGFENPTWQFDAPGWVDGLTFSQDGATLAVLGGAGFDGYLCLEVLDFAFDEIPSWRKRFSREWQAPAFGEAPAMDDDEELALGVEPGLPLAWPERVVLSPAGDRLIYPGPDGQLIELDAPTGDETRRWAAHEQLATTLDVEFTRGLVVSGGRDGQVVLWKADWRNDSPAEAGAITP